MDTTLLLHSFLALLFVLGLIGVTSVALRKYSHSRLITGRRKGAAKRLHVEETAIIDAKHRLVLLRCDDKNHLVLVGGDQPVLLDSTIGHAPVSLGEEAA